MAGMVFDIKHFLLRESIRHHFFPRNLGPCPTHSIDFNNNFMRYDKSFVEITGVLSKINPPEEFEADRLICPNCTGWSAVLSNETSKEICFDCYDVSQEVHIMDSITVPTALQVLQFEHPVYSKKLNVGYVFSDSYGDYNQEVTKRDIGKKYIIRGFMFSQAKKYGPLVHSDDLELITPDDADTVELVEESRDIPGYDEWRKEVLSRDKHCVVCGGDKHLHVHHLYGYKDYPDLRVDVSNGVTVCKFCHERYHSYYGLSDITPDKFIQFMRRFVVR